MALKFLNSSGSGSYSDAVRAFDYVTNLRNRGVDVRLSSNSWGGTGYSSSLYYAVNRAASAGHLIVAAAGNSNVNTDSSPHYPSSFTQNNVISVASMQSNGARSSFSNWGKTSVDIFAPGSGILSTLPSNSYAYYSGTSMATPHVSGAIILLASYAPHLGWEALRQAVLTTASYRSAYNNLVSTNGILNVRAMLESVGPTPTPGPSPTPTLTPTVTPTPIPTNTPTPTPTNTPTVTPTPAFYDVSGQVKDSNGTGMAGVRVDITVESGSFTQFTDAAGRYELNSLPGGGLRTIQVNLTASGRTFAPYSTLLNQNLEILHLAHPANYQLNGRVIRLQDALPIPNARVDGGTLGTVYTDNNGDFSFPVSWGQSYSLSVSHDEYIFDNRSVTGIIRGNTSRRFAGKH
ncbi:MAG: S8 family serine peptidase, partial [Bdellovibrionales bacterium]|nr:S8 family serine peptidase [Bdellovibrionales bacterium]